MVFGVSGEVRRFHRYPVKVLLEVVTGETAWVGELIMGPPFP
jgi:hypothetical protein